MDPLHVIYTTDEDKPREALIRELAEVRGQLSAERQQRRPLSWQLDQLTPQSVRETEKYFNPAVDAAKIGVYSHNLQTGEHHWSREFLTIYGLAPDDPLPLEEGIPKTIHPEDRQAFLADFHARLEHKLGPEYRWEHRIILPNQEIRWVMVRGQLEFDFKGRPLRTHGIIMDITALKQTASALRESESRYHGILDNMLEGCQIMSFDWRYLYLNDVAAMHGRHAKDEMLGRTVLELYPGVEETELFKVLRRCMHERKPHRMEAELVHPDGVKSWFQVSIQPVPEGIFILTVDIAHKQMEAERLESERRRQQIAKNESIMRMSGAVAHHFNNILAAVLGNLELAIEDLPPQEEVMQFLTAAEASAHRAVSLSKLMLIFLGQSLGEQELLDLSQTCRQHIETLQREIPEGVGLNADLPSYGPLIEADPARINQILTHLITNAWEAIKRLPGEVRVTVESINHGNIPIHNRFPIEWEQSAQAHACLSVTDTGCGMTVETISRIFDPFFSEKFMGRGLGLAVTLGIVKSLNGCIVVTSAPECGSRLQVYLPLYETA